MTTDQLKEQMIEQYLKKVENPKPKTFVNQSGLSFTDISSEVYRTYIYPGGEMVRIDNPTHLNVSKNGHRVFDAQNVSHYMPQGWIHLFWQVKEGEPNFVK